MLIKNNLDDLIQGVLNYGPDVLNYAVTDADLVGYIDRISNERLDYPVPPKAVNSENWFIPESYKHMNIEQHCLDLCVTEAEIARVTRELELYNKHNMIMVLRSVKYIVDTLREKNIVWGVGRGSSVASYVLFLLGVHKIDSIKYDIPLDEFFKGEQNE